MTIIVKAAGSNGGTTALMHNPFLATTCGADAILHSIKEDP